MSKTVILTPNVSSNELENIQDDATPLKYLTQGIVDGELDGYDFCAKYTTVEINGYDFQYIQLARSVVQYYVYNDSEMAPNLENEAPADNLSMLVSLRSAIVRQLIKRYQSKPEILAERIDFLLRQDSILLFDYAQVNTVEALSQVLVMQTYADLHLNEVPIETILEIENSRAILPFDHEIDPRSKQTRKSNPLNIYTAFTAGTSLDSYATSTRNYFLSALEDPGILGIDIDPTIALNSINLSKHNKLHLALLYSAGYLAQRGDINSQNYLNSIDLRKFQKCMTDPEGEISVGALKWLFEYFEHLPSKSIANLFNYNIKRATEQSHDQNGNPHFTIVRKLVDKLLEYKQQVIEKSHRAMVEKANLILIATLTNYSYALYLTDNLAPDHIAILEKIVKNLEADPQIDLERIPINRKAKEGSKRLKSLGQLMHTLVKNKPKQ